MAFRWGAALRAGVVAVAATGLVACGAGADGEAGADAPSTSPEPTTSTASGSDDVQTVTLTGGGTDIEAAVHPLVRTGDDLAVLTFDLRARAADESGEAVRALLLDPEVLPIDPAGEVRLVDLDARQVYQAGESSDGRTVHVGDYDSIEPGGTRVQLVFAAPPATTETMGLLLPGAFLPELPVVNGEVPGPVVEQATSASPATDEPATEEPATDEPAPIDLTAVVATPVADLESYSRQLDGAVSTLRSSESVEVSLGGDVLFASSSAELTPAADAVLDAAAAQLEANEPGTVEIVGHTDDVGDEAANQTLSQQRADAVAQALARRVDTGAYTLTPSGRGETQPVVPNDTDEHRAANRRVTLTLHTTVTTEVEVPATGTLPPFEGPTGTGAEGVEIESVRPYRVTAPQARRVGDLLVLELQVTALDDEVDPSFGPAFFSSVFSYRGDGTQTPSKAFATTLLAGSSAVYPLDHRVANEQGGNELWYPLADLDTLRRVDGGQTVTFHAVYPGFADADTVTVQNGGGAGAVPFRLTDVPVVD